MAKLKASDIEYKEFENLTHLAKTTHIKNGKHYEIHIYKDYKNDKIICAVSGQTSDNMAGAYSLLDNHIISLEELVNDFAAMIG